MLEIGKRLERVCWDGPRERNQMKKRRRRGEQAKARRWSILLKGPGKGPGGGNGARTSRSGMDPQTWISRGYTMFSGAWVEIAMMRKRPWEVDGGGWATADQVLLVWSLWEARRIVRVKVGGGDEGARVV